MNSPDLHLPLIQRAYKHGSKIAIRCDLGTFRYDDLIKISHQVASVLLGTKKDLNEARVAFIIKPGLRYAALQWGIWRAGGVAVPLCISHPTPELEYIIEDSESNIVVYDDEFQEVLAPLMQKKSKSFLPTKQLFNGPEAVLPPLPTSRRAMIIYTSGTTGKPKGVVSTHANIEAQVTSLVQAWEWTSADRTLNVLPLHHLHGIINILTSALWSGASCDFMSPFDARKVWEGFLKKELTLFMAVPGIYSRLTKEWRQSPPELQKAMTEACQAMRLMVCGSAALPVPLLQEWFQISGHTLLERYGMTEIGMALANPLHGKRLPGHVGQPLPGVQVRIVDPSGIPVPDREPGEIQVRGPAVFEEYWRRPEETKNSFLGGWFRTGDIATCTDGNIRIMGRSSTDIIKTGGFKVSALEIENELLSHDAIEECAVIGLPDAEWGERVCAAIKLKTQKTLGLQELRDWGKSRLAVYKIPSRIVLVDTLPRNAMGKILKPSVVNLFK